MHGSENRQRGGGNGGRASVLAAAKRPINQLAWLSLAVNCSHSERRWTKVNLAGRLWTPANGFEDRGAIVRYRPSTCIQARMQASPIRHRPQ